jgi:hypothetical protein
VRADLLSRHKKRHSGSYIPRNRVPSFSQQPRDASGSAVLSPVSGVASRPGFAHPATSVPHDAAILLTPDPSTAQPTPTMTHPSSASSRIPHSSTWASPIEDLTACNIIRPKPGYYNPRDPSHAHAASPLEAHPVSSAAAITSAGMLPFGGVQFAPDELLSRGENFAVWLFDPAASYNDFSVASHHLPFLEGGLESPFNSNIHYDYESLTSNRSQQQHQPGETPPPRQLEAGDELITEFRRQEVLRWFQSFRGKQPKLEPLIASLVHDSGGDLAALNLEMMRDCLLEFWEHVSPRLPIVHQPLFSCNRCPIQLLLVMIALGAASLRSRDSSGKLAEYGSDYLGFADVIIGSVRWEILTAEDAAPPVALWVAQALLLLEFYEKMYSARRLHERAHIYHSATLTLLRRGSPLIGRAGSESPPEESAPIGNEDDPSPPPPQMGHVHAGGRGHHLHTASSSLDSRTWWTRWAETESMHRVVFAAFMMDIHHAAMFGHAADMAPHEIRLPLPCDDNLWTASSPDLVRQLDANLRMYGVKPISFLDGLKRALHGKEVRTHSFGRMVIMSGLLSVGWHLSNREKHLGWLDLSGASGGGGEGLQDGWRTTLLRAYDFWKDSFDAAQGGSGSPPYGFPAHPPGVAGGHAGTAATGLGLSGHETGQRVGANGPIASASALYHLAHLSLYVEIIDCQVYAGAKRLLGKKISTRDYGNVVSRMRTWAALPSTRHSILHAFRLLWRVLAGPGKGMPGDKDGNGARPSLRHANETIGAAQQLYSCRSEPDPHRPWIMYYAALSIWSFVRALQGSASNGGTHAHPSPDRPRSTSHLQQHHVEQPQGPIYRVRGSTGPSTGTKPPFARPTTSSYRRVTTYLSSVAALREISERDAGALAEGLPEMLEVLAGILAEAQSELLKEACERLMVCRDLLGGGP